MEQKFSIRFGIRISFFFPNVAVFVFKVTENQYNTIGQGVTLLRQALPGDWGGQIVFEKR